MTELVWKFKGLIELGEKVALCLKCPKKKYIC